MVKGDRIIITVKRPFEHCTEIYFKAATDSTDILTGYSNNGVPIEALTVR